MRIRAALLATIGFACCVFACATAVDDPGLEIKSHDGGHEVGTSLDGGVDTGSTTTTDSGRSTTDSSVGGDTHVPPSDSGTFFDTYVPPPDDTGTAFDTYVPPPTDTGTGGGGPCIYCSSGTCADPFTDELCLINCLSAGYTDCSMSGTVCTCIP